MAAKGSKGRTHGAIEGDSTPSITPRPEKKAVKTPDIVAEKPKTDLKKIRVRLASTGTFLSKALEAQFTGGEVAKFGQLKLGGVTFNKGQIKTVYVTPEISEAIKNGLFEVLNPNPPEEVDKS